MFIHDTVASTPFYFWTFGPHAGESERSAAPFSTYFPIRVESAFALHSVALGLVLKVTAPSFRREDLLLLLLEAYCWNWLTDCPHPLMI